jgi:hypothetical protein
MKLLDETAAMLTTMSNNLTRQARGERATRRKTSGVAGRRATSPPRP